MEDREVRIMELRIREKELKGMEEERELRREEEQELKERKEDRRL